MSARGIYNKDGEIIGYLEGTRVFDVNQIEIGVIQGRTVYDRVGDRHWLLDGDAVLDLRGNVIGYLGQPTPDDSSQEYL
jgi:hypothetical protein